MLYACPRFTEEEVPAHEAAEVRLHLPHSPLRKPHGARDRSGERQAHSARGAQARVRTVARLCAHHPGLGYAVQRARSPAQDQEKGLLPCVQLPLLFLLLLGQENLVPVDVIYSFFLNAV